MRFLAMKYCTDCGAKRSLLDRLTATDDELCDRCYFQYMESLRSGMAAEDHDKEERF